MNKSYKYCNSNQLINQNWQTMTSIDTSIRSENHFCLKGLFQIGGQRDFTFPLGKEEYILVCNRFWDAKSLEVFISKDEINLLEIFTITNDHQFLEKVRNNFLLVELAKVNQKSKVIGLLRLSLHQFFIAYRDSTITNRLCEGQLPVVSADAWLPILNLATGEKVGEVECLLAIGTERQIENMKHSRNIEPVVSKEINIEQTQINGVDNACSMKVELNPIAPNLKAKKTSDLLNMLHKSLAEPSSPINFLQPVEHLVDRQSNPESFRVYLEIKNARGLPLSSSLKVKKKFKRNTAGKSRHMRFPSDEQPNTYVTFQAEAGNGAQVKSHEGMVYSTDVIEKTSNPIWSKSYYISVSLDYLTNKNKRFILKIWKKSTTILAHCRPLPCPMEDSIIGFAAIDLTTFLANVPFINGWFNIVDFSGHINGQIKVSAQPMDDLRKLIDLVRYQRENQVDNLLDSFESSLNINNISLSRAIKRKFTELEEISQRLRVRLLDVTGNAESEADIAEINDEQLDEFEHDLNTLVIEDENDNFSSHTNCSSTTSQSASDTQ